MPNDINIYHIVREADQRYDAPGIEALTRRRLLEKYPETEEIFIQEDMLLVRHPCLHPKFSKKLLPADKMYEVMKEEAEIELFEAIVALGAIELELVRTTSESKRNSKAAKVGVGVGVAKASGSIQKDESQEEKQGFRLKLAMHKKQLDISALEKDIFFNELVYNKNNRSLILLFDGIKAGEKFEKFELEFKHSISRQYKLEAKIEAKYLLFNAEINFTSEYEANKVESATYVAIFDEPVKNPVIVIPVEDNL